MDRLQLGGDLIRGRGAVAEQHHEHSRVIEEVDLVAPGLVDQVAVAHHLKLQVVTEAKASRHVYDPGRPATRATGRCLVVLRIPTGRLRESAAFGKGGGKVMAARGSVGKQATQLARHAGPKHPNRPELLFISPTLPDDRGNGLAMRGALFLRAFCRRWNVRLLVVDLFGTGVPFRAWPRVTEACAEAVMIRPAPDPLLDHIAAIPDPAWRAAAMAGYRLPRLASFAQPTAVRAALACLGCRNFNRVHAFRLYMAPFAAPFLESARSSLDADDDDACAAASMADLSAYTARPSEGDAHRAESARWAKLAADWAPRFDLVSFAAPGDAERLGRRLGLRTVCVPNAVRLPAPLPPPESAEPFTLLFVGTMSYLPNLDAATLLAREVLPALRRRSPLPLRLVLVGGPVGALAPLVGMPDVVVTGSVADLRPFYAASHVVLAPLRAGGGTRIKILEAMAHARPVVATPIGAEGLAAEDGVHLLLGADAKALAEACHRLQCRPELAATLSANGRALVARRYAQTVVMRQIGRMLSDE